MMARGATLARACFGVVVATLAACGAPPATMDATLPMETDAATSDDVVVIDVGVDAEAPLDAEAQLDAAMDEYLDVGGNEASTVDGGCGRAPTEERCNRFDDDCDGSIDEDACRTCRTCDACRIEVLAREQVYALCDGDPVAALEPWEALCERMGEGYHLVDLSDQRELDFLLAHVDTNRSWVGLRSFGGGALYDSHDVLRDEATLPFDGVGTDMMTNCVSLGPEGLRRHVCGGGAITHGFVCEGPVVLGPSELCVPRAETCNRVDDDCDGSVDERGACGDCEITRFAGHLYGFCFEGRRWDDARIRCQQLGGDLTMIDSFEENIFLLGRVVAGSPDPSAWIGAHWGEDQAAPLGGHWEWLDGRVIGGPEAPFTNWDHLAPAQGSDLVRVRMALNMGNWEVYEYSTTDPAPPPFVCELPFAPGP